MKVGNVLGIEFFKQGFCCILEKPMMMTALNFSFIYYFPTATNQLMFAKQVKKIMSTTAYSCKHGILIIFSIIITVTYHLPTYTFISFN